MRSSYTFSFAGYSDSRFTGFGFLKVLNESYFSPGGGFPLHPHNDMEIFTFIESGKMAHQDTTGATGEISPGKIQMMSAGTGLRHSEFNTSEGITHAFQIWLTPRAIGLTPEYRELIYSPEETINQLKLLISPEKALGSVGINQDAWIYESKLDAGQEITLPGSSETIAWLQMIDGKLLTGGEEVLKSDGVAYESLPQTVRAAENSHFIYILMAKRS